MNGKPDEHLDHWFRQSLSDLPDVPPPGSAFSSERLWEQVSPQLTAPATRRHPKRVWWAVAACLAGLLSGWFWLFRLNNSQPNSPKVAHRTQPAVTKTIITKSANRQQQATINGRVPARSAIPRTAKLPQIVMVLPVDDARQPPDSLASPRQVSVPPELVAVIVPAAKPGSNPAKSAVSPRRFQVVHVNELMAEDETGPQPHRTDHFVRLGSGRNKPASEEPTPAIILSLVNKPSQ